MLYKKFNLIQAIQTACIIVVLSLSSICPAFSASSYAQATRLSLELSEVTISDVFRSVEKESEYVFFYSDEVRSELS